jgi:nucleoside-diphosphate-sugar epimerase
MSKIIVIGSCGQIGTELVLALRNIHGSENVVAADLKDECPSILSNGPYIKMDILDRDAVKFICWQLCFLQQRKRIQISHGA